MTPQVDPHEEIARLLEEAIELATDWRECSTMLAEADGGTQKTDREEYLLPYLRRLVGRLKANPRQFNVIKEVGGVGFMVKNYDFKMYKWCHQHEILSETDYSITLTHSALTPAEKAAFLKQIRNQS